MTLGFWILLWVCGMLMILLLMAWGDLACERQRAAEYWESYIDTNTQLTHAKFQIQLVAEDRDDWKATALEHEANLAAVREFLNEDQDE